MKETRKKQQNPSCQRPGGKRKETETGGRGGEISTIKAMCSDTRALPKASGKVKIRVETEELQKQMGLSGSAGAWFPVNPEAGR